MRLCFGTFGTVLYYCRQYTNKAVLVAKLAMALDPESSYVGINRYDLNNDGEKLIGDKAAATKLLNCEKKYYFSSQQIPSLDTVIDKLKTEINDFIDKDKKAKVILALLDIIQKDDCLDFEKKESFKVFFGMEKNDLLKRSEYDFFDFLGRILMYTALGNVDNTVGKECVKSITSDYIDNVAESYLQEYRWNCDTQILTLFFTTMFNGFQQAIAEYKIDDFLRYIDPTVAMYIKWPEELDAFVNHINCNVLNLPNSNLAGRSKAMFGKIREFTEILDEYNELLGKNMVLLSGGKNNFFVPQYRDENVNWANWFTNETIHYRKQLDSIYKNICIIFTSE